MMMLSHLPAQQITYPETRKDDVKDDYFGTIVSDPYRWLEDDNSAETAAWVAAQNKITRAYLENIPLGMRWKKDLQPSGTTQKVACLSKKAVAGLSLRMMACKTKVCYIR